MTGVQFHTRGVYHKGTEGQTEGKHPLLHGRVGNQLGWRPEPGERWVLLCGRSQEQMWVEVVKAVSHCLLSNHEVQVCSR